MKVPGRFFLTILLSLPLAYSHPVPYKNAVGVMTWNQPFLSDSWVTYSFLPNAALAVRTMRMQMKDGQSNLYLPQVNYLLKRWNETDYQSNIYLFGGYGALRADHQSGAASLVGIEADGESRKYYISGKYEAMFGTFGEDFHSTTVRFGVAPYEAEYDEIASWFMLQAQYHPALTRNFALTPMVRFFYKSVLLETGVSFNGDWMINFMFHF